jgi:chemotaxis protein methyltransferase CheR
VVDLNENTNREREFSYTTADFEKVRKILYQMSGINLADGKMQLVYSRLARRLRALKLNEFSKYLVFMDANKEEQEEFVNALTTNLTAFFREEHHFDILANYAKKIKNRQPKLRVWCAAASTGEEPYSIAIALAEAYGTLYPPVEIIASDIDSKVLREGSNGVYTAQRLESVSLERKKQFFQRGKGANDGKARVVSELRKLIEFKQLNLLDSTWNLTGPFDVIFCRNVMIYFDKPTQLKLLERMTRYLTPDGLYVAGHSESFSQASHLVKLVDKSTYKVVHSSARASAHEL